MPQVLQKPTTAPRSEETARLRALRALEILDTPPEPCFDTITRMAAAHMQAEISYLGFVDETRVWVKSTCHGKLREFPRHDSHAERVVREGKEGVWLDLDTSPQHEDSIRLDHALGLRFFAGVPIRTTDKHVVGV